MFVTVCLFYISPQHWALLTVLHCPSQQSGHNWPDSVSVLPVSHYSQSAACLSLQTLPEARLSQVYDGPSLSLSNTCSTATTSTTTSTKATNYTTTTTISTTSDTTFTTAITSTTSFISKPQITSGQIPSFHLSWAQCKVHSLNQVNISLLN